MVMNLLVPKKGRNFFTSSVTISLSGKTPLYGAGEQVNEAVKGNQMVSFIHNFVL